MAMFVCLEAEDGSTHVNPDYVVKMEDFSSPSCDIYTVVTFHDGSTIRVPGVIAAEVASALEVTKADRAAAVGEFLVNS